MGLNILKGKWLYIIGVIGVVFILLQISRFFNSGPTVKYLTANTDKGDIRRVVNASGQLNPVVTVLVGSQVTGKIQEIFVDFNSLVKEGDVIAQIDPALFKARLEIAKAKLEGAKAEVEKAEKEWKRHEELIAKNMTSQSEADKTKALYLKSIAEKEEAQAEVELAQTNLNYTTIRSPVDGIVISRDVDVGQTVAASLQAPVLFNIAKDLKEMQINVTVDEADVGQVEVAQQVFFTVDSFPNEYFAGKVTQIRNSPNIIQNVVHYDVIVEVKNPELKLKPGMTAHCYIVTASKTNVLRVPNAAIRYLPEGVEAEPRQNMPPYQAGSAQAQKNEAAVWVLRFGKPNETKIKTGMKDDFHTEVLEGLNSSDEVIVGEIYQANKRHSGFNPLTKSSYKRGE